MPISVQTGVRKYHLCGRRKQTTKGLSRIAGAEPAGEILSEAEDPLAEVAEGEGFERLVGTEPIVNSSFH
jgi:hypothetical protein